MTLVEKDSIICSFKIITVLFLFYMLATGVFHLKNDFTNEVDIINVAESYYTTATTDELGCKTPLFLISFAFILGAFWNQNKILRFGVI